MFWFIVLLLLAGAGFYFYQKLLAIEREIRAEHEVEAAHAESSVASQPAVAQPKTQVEETAAESEEPKEGIIEVVTEGPTDLEHEILAAVENLPGVKQTELYASFPDVEKKKLQQVFKELADRGDIKREKKGSSYSLYPTETE